MITAVHVSWHRGPVAAMMKELVTLVVLCLAALPHTGSVPLNLRASRATTCGYESCTTGLPGMLNVHLIPHTHDDVGWLSTVDQYYYRTVQYILDTVVTELAANPARRFIYVETSFFWKWWVEQDERTQLLVKDLISSGQLEIIGGAWTMNDEAAAHYHSIIDQFTYALKKLNETFGACAIPHVGWQIDPFGHSREMASLFSQMGYDSLFFARIDYQDRAQRLSSKTTEMLWKASANLNSEIFTSVFYRHYSPPPGFCFDVHCNDEPIIDNPNIPDNNVEDRVNSFIDFVKEQAQGYPTNNILVTMGDDFTYQDAHMWFKNMDKLIRYVNEKQASGSDVNVFYSTPSCYAKAINDAGPVLTEKSDDFFPYADGSDSYWTGYFTSRPTTKYIERLGNNLLQVSKELRVLTQLSEEDDSNIDYLQNTIGVLQHHDAITGTEKQAVFSDYTRLISDGISRCIQTVSKAAQLLTSGSNPAPLNYESCLKNNVSECAVSEQSSSFVVTVYNTVSHPVTHYVRLPVTGQSYSVRDAAGVEQLAQLIPIPQAVLSLPERNSEATMELVFQAKDIPALGFRSYYVTSSASNDIHSTSSTSTYDISNENLQVVVDSTTGLLQSIIKNGVSVPVKQNFYYYEGYDGDGQKSGAYIFRPRDESGAKVTSETATVTQYEGDIVQEIHQKFNDWISQVIRIYKEENHVEFEWLVGPIPISDNIGKEVISRFTTNLNNDNTFYTDSNGREILERKVNFRPTWDLQVTQPTSGNYYPVTSKIFINDLTMDIPRHFAVINDRSQGGTSLNNGEVEVMLHRRLLQDDSRGAGEALNETSYGNGLIVRGWQYVFAGDPNGNGDQTLAAQERELAVRKRLSPWVLLASADAISFDEWTSGYTTEFSALQQPLPPNVQILTLERWREKTLLLRLEHILEKGEDATLSQEVSVDLQNLFAPFSITNVTEMTLAGNQALAQNQKLQWKSTSTPESCDKQQCNSNSGIGNSKAAPGTVTLLPMQIHTYLIEIS